MSARRTWLLAVGLLGWLAPTAGFAQQQSQELLERLLKFTPSQPGVEYETPTDKAVLAACKVDAGPNPEKQPVYTIRDGQGKLLRRFVDLDGKPDAKQKPTLDQFSYFQDGFEVYRETDLDGDRRLDEIRWMNSGGTRVLALKYEGEKVVYLWKRLSAEEATKVLVQGFVAGDPNLIQSVVATPAELAGLNLPEGLLKQLNAASVDRKQMMALQEKLKGWDKNTVWSRFDGQMPHAIPADPAIGLRDDVLLYENGVIFVGPSTGQVDPMKIAYLQAGEIVKIGDTWKLLGLPQAIDPVKPVVQANADGIRSLLFRGAPGDANLAGRDPALAEVERKLAQYDAENLAKVDPSKPKSVLNFHYNRLPLLRDILKLATKADDQALYNKQVVDDLATCYQTGLFNDGAKMLDDMIKEGKVASYAAFRKILAEYSMDDAPANPIAHQKAYIVKLEQFMKDYGKSEEAPDALLQLASNHEFNQDEDEAKAAYGRLARDFAASEPGKKAAGALKRLDLVGKPLSLRGANLKGETIDLAQFKGKQVVVLFWNSRFEPVRRELPELLKVAQKHKDKGLTIVGVNLDGGDKAAVDAFLKANVLPWPQIVEPEGMDGRLANEFGILSLPTMFLVDPQGKVVSRGLRTAVELDRLLDKSVANRGGDEAVK